ncbi:thiamine pyrophosphate-binding protein [Ramlibacter sp. WS9]|uniref:thiamine pyrophosphate-binding protein n=1 Tax=Ramlibacter sp. WS9 TaxID=1882741 RepID=UPI001144333B|nr:thiamine pyrophosphate-binding protein [Ramlibacter sp. WS9]ROZ78853.1 decarboxylase [Ramlibacter sp. WS9]
MSDAHTPLSGAAILDALKSAEIEYVISVPDLTTSDGVLRPLATDPQLKLLRVCREEEAIGICAGLLAGGKRAAILIQYTGFLASMNAIRAIAMEYRQPICMLVGLLFADAPEDPRQSANYGVNRMIPLIEAMGMPYRLARNTDEAAAIAPAITRAFDLSEPLTVLITRYPGA